MLALRRAWPCWRSFYCERIKGFGRLVQILRISHRIPEPNSQSQPAIDITTAAKKAALYGSCLTHFTRLLRFQQGIGLIGEPLLNDRLGHRRLGGFSISDVPLTEL